MTPCPTCGCNGAPCRGGSETQSQADLERGRRERLTAAELEQLEADEHQLELLERGRGVSTALGQDW